MINRFFKLVRRFFAKSPDYYIKRGRRVRCYAAESLFPHLIEIGDDFINAPGAKILTHDASLLLFNRKIRVQKTIIGNQVFLGLNAIIMPGVRVGNKVIIGAGTIVTKDVPDNSVVVGNPARIICTVDEYIAKCEQRRIAYDITDEFKKCLDENLPLTEEIQNALRKKVYSELQ